ncbi:MAG TPA: TadE family protein [Bryobacteraceae bacterium]|jgi:hypothetical protein|nr:TadE family protein [Bryobacteraceae bacterium]
MTPQMRTKERGNAVIEFALVSWVLLILLIGSAALGLSLARSITCNQVCRAAGSMYVRGVDFSTNGAKDELVRLAGPLGMTRTGGNGVVILSKVTWISAAACTAAGLSPCNANKHVIMERLTIGNASLRSSAIGTPNASLIQPNGAVTNYMQDASAVANFPFLQLNTNEFAYVAESYFPSPGFDFAGWYTGTGTYSRYIF